MNRVQKLIQDSLNVVNRMPMGAPQIDSQTYPDECDPTHPFHFDFYLATDVLIVNYVKLSFFLRAFRSPVASVNTATSGASSASSSASGASHGHTIGGIATDNGDSFHHHGWAIGGGSAGTAMLATGTGGAATVNAGASTGTVSTDDVHVTHTHTITGQTSGTENVHTHGISHTHTVTPTLAYGIFEGAVATGVLVSVNGTDRTAALGGGTGFTTNQTELILPVAWVNRGAWNTIDLTPSGLGRITGHLTVVSYIQSA